MTLVAFSKTPAGLFKVYDHGDDFQIIGKDFERWTSSWRHDRAASLKRAAEMIPNAKEIIYITPEK